MKYPIEIRTKKAFLSWVKMQNKTAVGRRFYIRMFDRPWIHTDERFEMLYGPFLPLTIPKTPGEAEEFWWTINENEIMVCMVAERRMHTIWCMAKLGIWKLLPQLHLFADLSEFKEVTHEEFEEVVGDKEVLDDMIHECWLMGISIRDGERVQIARERQKPEKTK